MDENVPLELGPQGGAESFEGDESNGSEHSFDVSFWNRVFRHAYSLVGNKTEAEDLAQETFVELFRTQSSGTSVQWIHSWARTVTRRLAYRNFHERRDDLHQSLETVTRDGDSVALEIADERPSPEQYAINENMVRLSAKVLSEFSDRERECVLMYFRGYDFVQIASALGVSRWTARRLTLNVIQEVRTRLKSVQTR